MFPFKKNNDTNSRRYEKVFGEIHFYEKDYQSENLNIDFCASMPINEALYFIGKKVVGIKNDEYHFTIFFEDETYIELVADDSSRMLTEVGFFIDHRKKD